MPPFVQVFHDVAYKAKDRTDLVAGIDEFLDQVTVLPPGEWDPSIRIEPPKNVPSQVPNRHAAPGHHGGLVRRKASWELLCVGETAAILRVLKGVLSKWRELYCKYVNTP